MPHTSRRKARSGSNKLTNVTGEDGWSVVSRKRNVQLLSPSTSGPVTETASLLKRTHLSYSEKSSEYEGLEETLTLQQLSFRRSLYGPSKAASQRSPSPAAPSCTQRSLEKDYVKTEELWVAAGMRGALEQILSANVTQSIILQISVGVCLGLGCLSSVNNSRRMRAISQLVALNDIVDILSKRKRLDALNGEPAKSTISLYAQDPAFNEVDRKWLASRNITVLHDPAAFQYVGSNAFVFAPCFPVAWWPPAMRRGEACLVIGNEARDFVNLMRTPPQLVKFFRNCVLQAKGDIKDISEADIPDLEARNELEEFLKAHKNCAFPGYDGQPELHQGENAFRGLRVYWRDYED